MTTKLEGLKLAEQLCHNPRTCLSILLSESETIKAEALLLHSPDFLINILQVFERILDKKVLLPSVDHSVMINF